MSTQKSAPARKKYRLKDVGELRTVRVEVLMTQAEVQALDRWREPHCCSRGEAVRRMVGAGVDTH